MINGQICGLMPGSVRGMLIYDIAPLARVHPLVGVPSLGLDIGYYIVCFRGTLRTR